MFEKQHNYRYKGTQKISIFFIQKGFFFKKAYRTLKTWSFGFGHFEKITTEWEVNLLRNNIQLVGTESDIDRLDMSRILNPFFEPKWLLSHLNGNCFLI